MRTRLHVCARNSQQWRHECFHVSMPKEVLQIAQLHAAADFCRIRVEKLLIEASVSGCSSPQCLVCGGPPTQGTSLNYCLPGVASFAFKQSLHTFFSFGWQSKGKRRSVLQLLQMVRAESKRGGRGFGQLVD